MAAIRVSHTETTLSAPIAVSVAGAIATVLAWQKRTVTGKRTLTCNVAP